MTTIESRNHRLRGCRPSFQSDPYLYILEDKRTDATFYFDDVLVREDDKFAHGGCGVQLLDHNRDPITLIPRMDLSADVVEALEHLQEFGYLPEPESLGTNREIVFE